MTVVEASVWVSYALPKDTNHTSSRAWLSRQLMGNKTFIPRIAMAEIGGAIARQTGDSALALATNQWLLQLPALSVEPVDHQLGNLAAHLAIALNLRGADAIYVALAQTLGVPLVTWDVQQRERAASAVTAYLPTNHNP